MPFSRNTDLIFADGPVALPQQPPKPDIRVVMKEIERAIDAYSSGAGSVAKQNLPQLEGSLGFPADTMAWVYADSVAEKNGIYRKSGASGAGSWSRILPLPFSFIIASDVGAGTPNAIQATSSVPVSNSALVWFSVAQTNSGTPVTVSFNGGAALTVKTNSGEDVDVGGIQAGSVLLGIMLGSTFRLFSDQAIAQTLFAARDAAEAARDVAVAAAGDTVAQGFVPIFESRTTAASFDLSAFSTVQVNRWAAGFSACPANYKKVASQPLHELKFQDAAGNWWELAEDEVDPLMAGADATGASDALVAINRVLSAPFKTINWGDADRTFAVSGTINETAQSRSWLGAATIKLVRSVVAPLFVLKPAATNFYCDPRLTFDHNAASMSAPNVANQVAIILCSAVILQAPGFLFSCKVLNAWDCGVSVWDGTWTGDGGATPYNASQVTSSPQSWRVETVYGENCGCGVHNFTAYGEVGQKGGVLNVATGADGAIGSVAGKNNYGGLLVDFGAGGEVSIGQAAFTGTKLDASNPSNGSGIDFYFAGSQINAMGLKSDNAGRCGLVVDYRAGTVNVQARIHASGKEGVRIDGGYVTGDIGVNDAGLAASGTYNAVQVGAGAADIWLNAAITVTNSGTASHNYSYASTQTGAFRVRGVVDLVSKTALTGPYSRGSTEVLRYAEESMQTTFGIAGLGRSPIASTTSSVFTNGDVSIDSPTGALLLNLYYDSGWKYLRNGYGAVIKLEASGGISISTAPSNSSGPGAAAAVTQIQSIAGNGSIGINEPSPDYKLDVNGAFGFTPGSSVTPVDNGDVVFQLTSNTQLTAKAKGSDGTVRSVNLTLA